MQVRKRRASGFTLACGNGRAEATRLLFGAEEATAGGSLRKKRFSQADRAIAPVGDLQ
eukprot:SAG11_NODE_1937_length_4032_cov_6.541826_6_plen_58_part_00